MSDSIISPVQMVPAEIQLHEFMAADYEAAVALWRSCEGIGLNDSDTPAGIATFLARNPGLSVIARDRDGNVVGAVLCGHDGRRGYLHHLAVAIAHRRRGLGRALVEACLTRLRPLGILKCNICLYRHNVAGRAFWLQHGWAAREDLVLLQRPVPAD